MKLTKTDIIAITKNDSDYLNAKGAKCYYNKDYKNAYECLSSEFKQNYFKTIDEFKNYVQKNFYDTNYITIKNVQTKSNVYTCTANIKSGVGVAADDMDKNFIIKLNPNAEFELSFEVE